MYQFGDEVRLIYPDINDAGHVVFPCGTVRGHRTINGEEELNIMWDDGYSTWTPTSMVQPSSGHGNVWS